MNHQHVKYLIAGGGVAGSAAAEAIRRHDPIGSVMLVGQEVNRPYNRPALSKSFLLRRSTRAELSALPVGWYAERHIELRTGRRLTSIDAARASVALDSGEEISFDKLLLCTGANARHLNIPGADLPNVFYLRTLGDAERITHATDTAKEFGHSRCAIVGGGLLGTELAATLSQAGMHVDLIESGETPWPALTGRNTGQFIVRLLERHGMTTHCGQSVVRFEGDGRAQRVITSNGTEISCDFVVAAVGVQFNRDILRGTPIAAETAVLVDNRCQSSVSGIFAAGDCAALLDPLFGKHRLLDHWDNARITGNLAGTNMAGGDDRYDAVNHFWSELFDQTPKVWGEAKLVYRRLLRGLPGDGGATADFAEIGIAADGRIAQVIAFGRRQEHDRFEQLVARRVLVEGREEEFMDTGRALLSIL